MTRPRRRAGKFTVPARALVFTSSCVVFALPLLAGCTDNRPTGASDATASVNPRILTVQATDSECKLSSTSAPSGTLTFAVTNGGAKVTEFYLYGEDGKRIVGEVENIGPGITRELVMKVKPGSYITACKPGMAGDGDLQHCEFAVAFEQRAFGIDRLNCFKMPARPGQGVPEGHEQGFAARRFGQGHMVAVEEAFSRTRLRPQLRQQFMSSDVLSMATKV